MNSVGQAMHGRSPTAWNPPRCLPALRRSRWRTSIAWGLCLLLLFALAAPGISGWFNAAHAEHQASPQLCAEHREHLPEGACDAQAVHAAHGVHCGFCLLFSHVPVVAGASPTTSASSSLHALPPPAAGRVHDLSDATAAWIRRHKHGPPAFG